MYFCLVEASDLYKALCAPRDLAPIMDRQIVRERDHEIQW